MRARTLLGAVSANSGWRVSASTRRSVPASGDCACAANQVSMTTWSRLPALVEVGERALGLGAAAGGEQEQRVRAVGHVGGLGVVLGEARRRRPACRAPRAASARRCAGRAGRRSRRRARRARLGHLGVEVLEQGPERAPDQLRQPRGGRDG